MKTFSIVTVTKDNPRELIETLETIPHSDKYFIEQIIVDSSKKENFDLVKKFPSIKYFHTEPKGIYNAHNYGLSKCSGDFIILMTSGDGFLQKSQKLLEEVVINNEFDIFVFSQEYRKTNGDLLHRFQPDARSLWPQQSLILNSKIVEDNGYFTEDFFYSSDQIYFAKIRKKNYKTYYSSEYFSYFTHGGVSSDFNLKKCNENYIVWRLLNYNYLYCIIKSYVLPTFRFLIEDVAGLMSLGHKLRKIFFKNVSN